MARLPWKVEPSTYDLLVSPEAACGRARGSVNAERSNEPHGTHENIFHAYGEKLAEGNPAWPPGAKWGIEIR